MSLVLEMDLLPNTRYRRQLDGADFSLEANTDSVPEEGHFYLLRNGEVELESDNFPEAVAAYQAMCRDHWSKRLGSADTEERMASAWGLIGLEPEHKAAVQVIKDDGSADDMKRLEQLRRRKRFAKRRGPFGRARKG